jgi:hypothetical protein
MTTPSIAHQQAPAWAAPIEAPDVRAAGSIMTDRGVTVRPDTHHREAGDCGERRTRG